MTSLAEVRLTDVEAQRVNALRYQARDLATLEADALAPNMTSLRACVADTLATLRERVLERWRAQEHVVLRNVPASDDGSTGLVLAMSVFAALKPYRGQQIVKHFRMSPWTTALSHTLASGFFHTDINTADIPPAATIIQCLEPDPGAPDYGQIRVTTMKALLEALRAGRQTSALRLLEQDSVTMVNETSPAGWRGRLIDDDTIRFHPESLIAAQRRHGTNPADLDECLNVIHETAISISAPIHLDPGELVMISNRRALHQRGPCTVRFREYPSDFDARKVAVLHTLGEPA